MFLRQKVKGGIGRRKLSSDTLLILDALLHSFVSTHWDAPIILETEREILLLLHPSNDI